MHADKKKQPADDFVMSLFRDFVMNLFLPGFCVRCSVGPLWPTTKVEEAGVGD
jgi:hypothetical protein